ncbi:protein transport protein Sec24C-like isoform X1 [Argiope bruennichi]|uniref:Protein transport protein Sec24C like protein n=1 Tax=Argiope bruennichi TaxID=94029 RepID=A0A8T0EUC4_ARGBR|nr:protein transport protein Sec24C-like isoform X1 [Argiope bruennichi]XP_055932679.1 protein transport protein Sec24C-like isoform X1 [Argiope bruennichi]XP_055932680.1 protein transport protein Sec24C-like isoform X1 [Argiope bruennichi]KAF8781361.1 Protein transport protein Sec24C like protein [Argiope bruennichi]
MNPHSQYDGQMRPPGSFIQPYNQSYQQNSVNNYDMQSGPAVNKGYPPVPYGNPGMQNGPSGNFPGPLHNQSTSQVQSPAVPPTSQIINNQMSQDFNAMHLSQNQNHLPLTHPSQRHSNNMPPAQIPSNIPGQQQYWQQPQPPRMSQPSHAGPIPNPPSSYSSNVNVPPYPPYNADPSSVLPTNNNSFPSTMQHSDRTVQQTPPPGQSNQINNFPSKMQNPEMFQQQRSIPPPGPFRPGPYTNGTTSDGVPSVPLANQYSQQNSSMNARYPPSQSPVPNQGGGIPPSSATQYGHPPASNLQAQNRLGSLPQPPQNRRLDPDNMPSPIQVIEDDRKLRSCTFSTAQRGLVPPLVTTNFTVVDEGICSPRFIRSTIYNVPTTAEMLKQTCVPFALAISPFARVHEGEHPPHIVDPGDEGPVRCHRCRAYMSPFMQFIDAGRRFQCMLCKTTTEVPAHYFTHLDHMGQRVDKLERAELCLGSYEFVVNKDYCKEGKFPNCPAFIFVIDVSYNSIRNGMVKTLCDNMKSILSRLPREDGAEESKLRVGFVTYGSAVHFYNLNSNLAQPQMLVVSDVNDMFMPLLDGFLVNPTESAHVIDSLMEQIPIMFADTKDTETVLGPAIQAGLEALRAAECAGKLFVFHTTLPIAEAPGKLKNREDRKLLGTDKEKTILSPQTPFYNNIGQECVKAGCAVDLFLFNNAYIDIATLGQVCRLTGGQLYKYTYFQADIDGERFIEDLRRNVEKPIAFDAVLRVRTSTGIRPTEFIGCFFMSNTTDVELATVSCDTSLSIEIKYDDKLTEDDGVCIQCAILYTSCSGQRRLRVHNLALNTCTQMAELYRNCELDAVLNFFLKESVRKVTEETPKQIREYLIYRSAQILACYRKNCAQASSTGQLILPECMKLLPLYINCLIKCDALSGGQEISTDDRSFIMLAALSMDVDSSAAYLYPRLLPLHDIKPQPELLLPTAIRCSLERLKENGIYLIENGLNMFLWIGMNADSEWIQNVFGVPTVARIDVDKTRLLQLNNPLSQYVHWILNQVQSERQRNMKLYIVRQGDKLELLFRQLLVEDRTTEGSSSYVDFLCHLHKEIRTLLS